MKIVRVAVVPQPVASPSPPRRESVIEMLRREWRGLTRSNFAGYSEH